MTPNDILSYSLVLLGKHPPRLDGGNLETDCQKLCSEGETLKHSVPNAMSPSNFSP